MRHDRRQRRRRGLERLRRRRQRSAHCHSRACEILAEDEQGRRGRTVDRSILRRAGHRDDDYRASFSDCRTPRACHCPRYSERRCCRAGFVAAVAAERRSCSEPGARLDADRVCRSSCPGLRGAGSPASGLALKWRDGAERSGHHRHRLSRRNRRDARSIIGDEPFCRAARRADRATRRSPRARTSFSLEADDSQGSARGARGFGSTGHWTGAQMQEIRMK